MAYVRRRPIGRKLGKRKYIAKKKKTLNYKKKQNYVPVHIETPFRGGAPNIPTIGINIATTYTYEYSASISNIPVAELAAYRELYDSYKIKRVGLKFVPTFNSNDSARLEWFTVVDYNDTSVLPNVAAALEYSSCKRHNGEKTVIRYCYPQIPYKITDISNTTFVVSTKPGWLQLDNAAVGGNAVVAHCGIKLITAVSTSASSLTYDCFWILDVLFKSKK